MIIRVSDMNDEQKAHLAAAIVGQKYQKWWRGRTIRKSVTKWRRQNRTGANGLVYPIFQVRIQSVSPDGELFGQAEYVSLEYLFREYSVVE